LFIDHGLNEGLASFPFRTSFDGNSQMEHRFQMNSSVFYIT